MVSVPNAASSVNPLHWEDPLLDSGSRLERRFLVQSVNNGFTR
jgi:hypothetical protein